jgi:ABC-type transporter Mla MlaB component
LKVTIQHEEGKHVTLKIEGKVAGPMVSELRRAWRDLATVLGPRKLRVDLCGVTHLDGNGQSVLAEIHAKTGAEFLADTPLTKYFAEAVQRGIRTTSEEDY